jgi:hypothetical protein
MRWDRIVSVLGFWALRGIAFNASSGRRTDHERGCGSGANATGFAATNVHGVADGRGMAHRPRLTLVADQRAALIRRRKCNFEHRAQGRS